MNDNDKPRIELAKLEKFFSEEYKDELYEIFDNYPDKSSLTVDFTDLEVFDLELAENLIHHPTKFLETCKSAVNGIDPFMRHVDLEIRFKNMTNEIPLDVLSSRMIGQFVKVRGSISNVSKPEVRLDIAAFECRGCMRVHEVEQALNAPVMEPSLCSECGGRSFRILQNESKFEDIQTAFLNEIVVDISSRHEPSELMIVYEGDLVRQLRENDIVDLTGTLKTFMNEKTREFENYLYVNHIEFVKKWTSGIDDGKSEQSSNGFSKNSNEYKAWRGNVLKRDKGVCQCCGLEDKLQAHHIFGCEEYPEMAYDEDNGITLCKFCHDKYHSIYGKGGSTPVKFIEFLRRFGNG